MPGHAFEATVEWVNFISKLRKPLRRQFDGFSNSSGFHIDEWLRPLYDCYGSSPGNEDPLGNLAIPAQSPWARLERIMPNHPAIRVQGLNKSYGNVQALRGVDLEVRSGEIFGFLGPNGAGKTTTIRCLLDLIRPDSGTIRVLGLNPQADSLEVRKRVGYLPGELRLDDNFTVEAVLRFLDYLRGGSVDWKFIHQLAERIDLDLKMQVKNLSKGNKQKVGILQAIMHRPELLLLDEPTSGLDPLMQQEVLRVVVEARAAGATVFFSSHNLSEVQGISERVGIIRRGTIAEVAETKSLINRSIRRVHVRFRQPVEPATLIGVPGVKLLSQDDGLSLTLQIEGEMDTFVKVLATFPVVDFETERPSLEEIFLAYYAD
jgi:ABC-2 type transport system ATP-binding protein